MITHIVSFKLVKNDNEAVEFMVSQLKRLNDLPFLAEFDVVDRSKFLKNDLDGDVLLFSKFDTEQDLKSYMIAPLHLEVIKNTSPNIAQKHILDFNS